MSKQIRVQFEHAFYHVFSRGNTRSRIFKDNSDRLKFLYYLNETSKKFGIIIHSYCLMNNHYHLFIETPHPNLIKAMHKINNSYTKYYNKRHERSGHLFAGRYKSILVEEERYAVHLSAYIHLNPVRKNMVERPEDYIWSSYRYFLFDMDKPNFLEKEVILKYAGGSSFYKKYIDSQDSVKFNPDSLIKSDIVLGSLGYYKKIKKIALDKYGLNIKEDYEFRKKFNSPIIEKRIRKIIDIEIPAENVVLRKKLLIFLYKEYTEMKLKEIGQEYNISKSAVSKTYVRFLKELERSKDLLAVVKNIMSQL